MADEEVNSGPPRNQEERDKIGCHHEFFQDDKGVYKMNCVFPKANPDGSDRKIVTERILFMGKICTACMLNDTQTLFKLTDKQLRAERELQAKKGQPK